MSLHVNYVAHNQCNRVVAAHDNGGRIPSPLPRRRSPPTQPIHCASLPRSLDPQKDHSLIPDDVKALLDGCGVETNIVQSRLHLSAAAHSQSITALQSADKVADVIQVLSHHQALGMVSRWAQLVECTPEVLYSSPTRLRCLLTECRDHLHMVDQDFQALSVSLRNDREASYAFFNALDPRCLGPRYDNVVSILNLDVDRRQRNGSPKLVCFHPKLLLVDHNVLSSAAGWLSSMLGWHREVLRHNIATLTDYDILTRNTSEFDTVVDHLMLEMNMSVHEVSCLLRCVPSLLLLEVNAINALASRYPSSFQLAAALLQQEGNPTGGWVTSVGVLRANPRLGQLNTLYLLSKGVSPEEIERLVTEKPTLLRRPLWENEDNLL